MVQEQTKTDEWRLYDEPCPHCGSLSFKEYTSETYRVEMVEDESDGDVEYTIDDIIVRDSEINEVWCRECDTKLIEHSSFGEYL